VLAQREKLGLGFEIFCGTEARSTGGALSPIDKSANMEFGGGGLGRLAVLGGIDAGGDQLARFLAPVAGVG
jgi:hypothetical protein